MAGDLEQFVPQVSPIVDAIFGWHKSKGDAEDERMYLGASILGHECERFLWYSFRGCVTRNFEGRLYRLFETGQLAESRFIAELEGIGCRVHDVTESGDQFEVSAFGGHLSGHMDGCALGVPGAEKTWHVLEFKTHNAKSFKALTKSGVASKPMHYAQMQVYMGLSGMTRALYLASNKDTDDLYAERVRFDKRTFDGLMDRARQIIITSKAPERFTDRQDDWRCKFCDARHLCFGMAQVAVPIPKVDCRTCCHASPDEISGKWICAISGGRHCPLLFCEEHLLLPSLVTFARPGDAGNDWIEFTNIHDDAIWRHGNSEGCWTSDELISSRGPLDGAKKRQHIPWSCDAAPCNLPQCAKHHGELFVCDVCGQGEADLEPECPGPLDELRLVDQFDWGDSERIWSGPIEEVGTHLDSLISRDVTPLRIEVGENYRAYRYGDDMLVVLYPEDNIAAIWRGKGP